MSFLTQRTTYWPTFVGRRLWRRTGPMSIWAYALREERCAGLPKAEPRWMGRLRMRREMEQRRAAAELAVRRMREHFGDLEPLH